MKTTLMLVVACLSLALAGGVARADQAEVPADPAASYTSPDRARCEDELRKDKAWYAELKLQVKDDVHIEEAATITRNNKHVVIAYAAIWVLAVGFLVLLWLRQGKLTAEIARLEREIAKASEDATS